MSKQGQVLKLCGRIGKTTLAACGVALVFLLAAGLLPAAPPKTALRGPLSEGSAAATIPALPYPSQLAVLSDPDCQAPASCRAMSPLQIRVLALVNAGRLDPANRQGTGGRDRPLMWDPRLAAVALAHSQDMALHHYFGHYDRSGNSPAQRLGLAGIAFRAMGENIATNYTVSLAEQAFMNEPRFEPNHRANVLNSRFNFVGIGIAHGSDGLVYVTEEFAQEP